jgi:hypothetical protein
MKKTITTLLISGIVLSGLASAGSAFADDTQTITGKNSSNIAVTGNIGQFDPETTDPEEPGVPGPGDEAWIKVQLPTSVAYYSTGSSDHKEITSADATIKNKSNYPVAVTLADFNDGKGSEADVTGVDTLNLNADGKAINLIDDHAVSFTSPTEMFKLGSNKNASKPVDTSVPDSKVFNFSGTTHSSVDLENLTKTNNNLELTFEALENAQ